MITPYALLLISVGCGWICYTVAKRRNADIAFWLVMAALFGPLAVPFVFFAKPKLSDTAR